MIAETLAGIALVKSAVDGIKSAIGTANDIGDIAGYIDNLFEGEKQVQHIRNKKAGSVGIVDQFGVSNVARDVIDARIAAEKLQEVATMVDMRFGPGTWKSIVGEHQSCSSDSNGYCNRYWPLYSTDDFYGICPY